MQRSGSIARRHGWRALGIAFLAGALALSACGGDDDDDDAAEEEVDEEEGDDDTDATAAPEDVELTDLGDGVFADRIKIGIVMVDYDTIADFIDFARGDQEEAYQAFIDDINENGGVLGRRLEPVYKFHLPIGSDDALRVCEEFTQDEDVFAIIGVYIDFAGAAHRCVTTENNTIHIGHELRESWIQEAPPALLLTVDITNERRSRAMLRLMDEEGLLEGRTVGILADQNLESLVNDAVRPTLEEYGVELSDTGILTIVGEDTTQAQGQLDGIIEAWKADGVDTIYVSGLLVSARQFIEKIAGEIPDVMLISDASSTLQQARDVKAAGIEPNPYANLYSLEGKTQSERWEEDEMQECVAVFEEATGKEVVGPDDVVPGPDGKRDELNVTVQDACGDLGFFVQVATEVGPELTYENWAETVNNWGPIDLLTFDIGSLGEGKYDAEDGFRLVMYDDSIGETGDWKGITELESIAEEA